MKSRALEITVWDFDRFGATEFLGEVLIELATAPLDDEPEWYLLAAHEEIFAQLVGILNYSVIYLMIFVVNPTETPTKVISDER